MDCRNWPRDKIMQLPDEAFGPRWWISTYVGLSDANPAYNVAEEQLPERCVVWSLLITLAQTAAAWYQVGLRLAHEQRVSAAEWLTYEKLFLEFLAPSYVYDLFFHAGNGLYLPNLRYPITNRPRHLCTRVVSDAGTGYGYGNIALLVSGFPTEVPDWLISNQGKNRI